MKKAIIVGASSGIGKGLAQLLADQSYKVGITGRRTGLLDELKSERPEVYFTQYLDVADTHSCVPVLTELVEALGGLDLLVISAGTGDINKDLDFSIEKRTIDTNVLGFTCIADWAFNYFQAQNSGHLVGISSIAGIRGNRHAPAYNASKAYQISYLEALRQKAANLNASVSITDIRPGFVDTDMAKGEGQFWVAPVDKAVRQIAKAITQKSKVVYVTKRWRLIAGILRLLPRAIYDRF